MIYSIFFPFSRLCSPPATPSANIVIRFARSLYSNHIAHVVSTPPSFLWSRSLFRRNVCERNAIDEGISGKGKRCWENTSAFTGEKGPFKEVSREEKKGEGEDLRRARRR